MQVGRHHELSAGLLIGGKDVKEEQKALAGMNILVATPGRLLQHMDETAGFDTTTLQVLVRSNLSWALSCLSHPLSLPHPIFSHAPA